MAAAAAPTPLPIHVACSVEQLRPQPIRVAPNFWLAFTPSSQHSEVEMELEARRTRDGTAPVGVGTQTLRANVRGKLYFRRGNQPVDNYFVVETMWPDLKLHKVVLDDATQFAGVFQTLSDYATAGYMHQVEPWRR